MKEGFTKRLEGDYNQQKGVSKLFRSDLANVKFWTAKEGQHIIDIIPYVAGGMDPKAKKGEDSYVLEIYVHRDVGVREGYIICMSETFGKACPVCEERRRLIKSGGDEQKIKDLTPSRYPRSIYNIVCYDGDEASKGIQVWHTSNFLMQQYLLELAKRPVRPGQKNVEPFIAFMDPDDGRSIVFKTEGKQESLKHVGIRFEERQYTISDELLENAHCLDELIAWPTYEQAYEDFWGFSPSAANDVPGHVCEEPAPRKSKQPEPEPEVKKQPEPEPEPEPEVETTRRRRAPAESEPEVGAKCPFGGTLGVDIDEMKECDKCNIWKECAKEADRIELERKKK
jgi:hypothetical protein